MAAGRSKPRSSRERLTPFWPSSTISSIWTKAAAVSRTCLGLYVLSDLAPGPRSKVRICHAPAAGFLNFQGLSNSYSSPWLNCFDAHTYPCKNRLILNHHPMIRSHITRLLTLQHFCWRRAQPHPIPSSCEYIGCGPVVAGACFKF